MRTTSVILPDELIEWVDEQARKTQRSRSYIIRSLIEKAKAE